METRQRTQPENPISADSCRSRASRPTAARPLSARSRKSDCQRADPNPDLLILWRSCARGESPEGRVCEIRERPVCSGRQAPQRGGDSHDGIRNDSSWDALLEVLRPIVRRRVGRLLSLAERDRDPGLVDDREQDVYVRLLGGERRAMRECRARSWRELVTFVRAVCDSVVYDWHRGEAALKRGRHLESRVFEDIVRETFMTEFGTPEQRLFVAELDRHCSKALESTCRRTRHPERNRWIYERAVVDGWTTDEISGVVGLGVAGVDSTVRRLRSGVAQRAQTWRPESAGDLQG